MKFWLALICWVLLTPMLYAEDLDEWLGDSDFSRNSLELSAGGDNDNGRSIGAHLSLALPAYAHLDISYSAWSAPSIFVRQEFVLNAMEGNEREFGGAEAEGRILNVPLVETAEIKLQESSFDLWLSSDSFYGLSVALGYESQDKVDTLKADDISLKVDYEIGRWEFSGIVSRGDISVVTAYDFGFLDAVRDYKISRSGVGVQMSYDFSQSHWRLRYDDYRYDKTFSVINNLDRYRESARKFFIVDRASYLTDWRLSSDVQWYVNALTLLVGVSQSQTVVESKAYSQMYFGGYYPLTGAITVGVVLGTVIDGDISYGESSIGYSW